MKNNQKLAELYRKRTYYERENFRRFKKVLLSGFPVGPCLFAYSFVYYGLDKVGNLEILDLEIWQKPHAGMMLILTIITITNAVYVGYNGKKVKEYSRKIVKIDRGVVEELSKL